MGTRQYERIKIDGRDVKVSELKAKHIRAIWSQVGADGLTFDWLLSYGKDIFDEAIEGLTVEDMWELTPSEIDEVWQAFRRVNDRFFLAIEKAGLKSLALNMWDGLLDTTRKALSNALTESLAGLSKPDTPIASTTDGDSSTPPYPLPSEEGVNGEMTWP